jgi:F-type H+-transporting ATPase subunit gamma
MANLKEITRRIKSVKNTQQITRAMKMVAAANLRKAQNSLFQARPYTDKMIEMLERIGEVTDISQHDLLSVRDVKKELYIVVAADRGLCGSFNAQLNRFASDTIDEVETDASIIVVGNKAKEYFSYRNYNIIGEYLDLGDNVSYSRAQEIAEAVTTYYLNGLVDSVKIVYARFVNTMVRKNTNFELLPVAPPQKPAGIKIEYIFDPSPESVLDELLPRYIATTLFRAMLESKASEQGSRMAAMDAATKNAEKMIKKLTIQKNRARQAAITTEISEIVGGAEALK